MFASYRDSRENLHEILAVVIILSLISSAREYSTKTSPPKLYNQIVHIHTNKYDTNRQDRLQCVDVLMDGRECFDLVIV